MRFSLLFALAGCDGVFGLQHIHDRSDAGMSVQGVDARPGCTLDTFSNGMTGFAELWSREQTPPGSEVVVETGKLAITIAPTTSVYGQAFMNRSYDLTGATISLRVDQVIGTGSAETFFDLANDATDDYYEFSYSSGMLRMRLMLDDAVEQNKAIPYDAVQHAHWRFQHIPSRSAIALFTSPDGVSWTEQHSILTSVAVVSLLPEIGAGIYSGSVPDGVSLFDDFELCL